MSDRVLQTLSMTFPNISIAVPEILKVLADADRIKRKVEFHYHHSVEDPVCHGASVVDNGFCALVAVLMVNCSWQMDSSASQ